MKFSRLFVAGTFDGLHAGHRFLLTRAFNEGERVTIGLTSDAFVRKFKVQTRLPAGQGSKFKVRTHNERKKILEQWLEKHNKRALIIPIDDPYEPAASMKDLDALIVTRANRKTGEHINVFRQGSTLPSLTLIEVPMVSAADGKPISSTRMRNGEIDHNGRLVMPESMREALRKPLGKVIKRWIPGQARNDKRAIITVGDIATKTFLDAGITPTLSIIDGKVGRKPFGETLRQLRKTTPCEATSKSGPGYISKKATQVIQATLETQGKQHHAILIDGEEDLLVLPAVLHAPIGAVVYYGQPNEGLVEVVVTRAKKRQALALLAQFLS